MNNKKIFLFAFLSLFLVGCDSIGGVKLTDTKGNKYIFKNESVTCRINKYGSTYCEGSAIKKDIAGKRYAYDFREEMCKYMTSSRKIETVDNFICDAAKKLGKI